MSLSACGATLCRRSRQSDTVLSKSEGLDHVGEQPACFAFASGGVLSDGYDHGGPASAWPEKAKEVPSQFGRAASAYAPYLN